MVVSNEDKIALLEFLGFTYGGKKMGIGWYHPSHEFYFAYYTENDFNIDISILTKALDIIEKEGYYTSAGFQGKGYDKYHASICSSTVKSHVVNIRAYELTREEAILKAVLEYIKTTKL